MFLEIILASAVGYDQRIDPVQTGCMAEAIWFEARNQPLQGQVYVAQTIMNRVGSSGYPNTICEVVHQPYQFSYTLIPLKERNKTIERANTIDQLAMRIATIVALQAVTGGFRDLHLSQHYYNPSKADPSWAYTFDNSLMVGDHKFLW